MSVEVARKYGDGTMSGPQIVTQGRGVRSLKEYFELFHHSLPHKLPARSADWDMATYDAPYGFLYTWPDGTWKATLVLDAVAADIAQIRGVRLQVSVGQ
jgi:hypothetical protein